MVCKFYLCMSENAFDQSDCGIHKSAISQEQLSQSGCLLLADIEDLQWCWVKNTLSHEITEFLKQQYLKKDEVNQSDILYVNRDSGKLNPDLNRDINVMG